MRRGMHKGRWLGLVAVARHECLRSSKWQIMPGSEGGMVIYAGRLRWQFGGTTPWRERIN